MSSELHKARVKQWVQIINDCNNRIPGLTKKAWLEQHGIKLKRFEYWQRVVRTEAMDQISDSISDNDISGGCLDITDRLLQQPEPLPETTSVPDNKLSAPQPQPLASPDLIIQTGSYLVYVNETVREKTLRSVLRALKDA
ncbi:MAG: hypothetical protein LUG93_07975 [Lachnospiraceae bacterium]|nr:hypothetical protein [Lachnospiraceae bacterium]